MAAIGGSILTTEGLNVFLTAGASIVPKYFKFSSNVIPLTVDVTDTDFVDAWIQKDISLVQTINANTIEFVCDILPGEATNFTNTCGLYLEDGTLFMVATPPSAFPSGLRQTFRIQLVYENADNMMDFQYIDMDTTNMKFVEANARIDLLDSNTDARMTQIETTHTVDNTASMARLDALESVDTNVDARIDSFEALYTANKNTTDASIDLINTERVAFRTEDLAAVDASQAIQDARLSTNETDITAIEAKSILDRTELESRIDDVILNSDVGVLSTTVASNTDLINSNYSTLSTAIANNATADAQDKTDLTNLINAEASTRQTEDGALSTRIDSLSASTTTSLGTVNAEIDAIDALIINNKASADSGIATNAAAILALGGGIDVDALQLQVDMLDSTVSTNNTNITNALATSDTASDTWNNAQDDAIAVNNTFRTDTFPAAQAAQDAVIAANLLANDTWNTTQDSRILVVETQLTDLPDSVALGLLYDDVDNLKLLTDDFLNGYTPVGLATLATTANKWTTARSITLTGDVTGTVTMDGSANVSFATTVQVEALPAAGTVGQILTNTAPGTGTWQDAPISYVHPTYLGDDFSIDTGALSGATVISDIDINVTTDTFGHVTDTNATVATRTLTAANIGAAAATHTHAYLPLAGGTVQELSGLTIFGSTARNSDNIVEMRVNSGYKNLLKMTSASQGSAEILMGQSVDHAGGFIYNADDTPDEIGTSDVFSAIRVSAGIRYQQFSWYHTSPDVTFNGDVIANSDIRVKNNIEVIENALDKIDVLRGVTFNRNDIGDAEIRMTGVIAQEVLAVLPEAVKADEAGKLSVAYGNMVGLLIEGIKEQNIQMKAMQIEIDNLKDICVIN